jgi:hypothetical protein
VRLQRRPERLLMLWTPKRPPNQNLWTKSNPMWAAPSGAAIEREDRGPSAVFLCPKSIEVQPTPFDCEGLD